MRELKLNPVDGPIIDIFDYNKMSDAEVIAAVDAIEVLRLNRSNKYANLQLSPITQSDATSTPGSSRA